jgi:hypothetical protein
MTVVLRVVFLASLVVLLGRCGAQGCSDIPEASTGACRVGLPPDWETDSSRYTK